MVAQKRVKTRKRLKSNCKAFFNTDKDGKLEQRWAYDAWGLRSLTTNSCANTTTFLFDRGYTMHEHLETFKLINMNGRVYDPILGRFLSPDNFVQDAGSTQAYNRYTYCLNNPLAYTDPSGWISTEAMPFQWIAPTYYFSSFFQPKFGAFAGDNYAVEYFSNFHNGGSHLAGAEVAGNFRSRGSGVINSILNSLYHWDKNSNSFRNGNNNKVSWNEVYTNYVVPNATRIISGDELRKSIYSVTGAMAAQLTGVVAGSSGGFHCAPTINDPTKIFLMTMKLLKEYQLNPGKDAQDYSVARFYSVSFSIIEDGVETPYSIDGDWVIMRNHSPKYAACCEPIPGVQYNIIERDYYYRLFNKADPAFFIEGPIKDYGGTDVWIHRGEVIGDFLGCWGISDQGYNSNIPMLNDGTQRVFNRLYTITRSVLGNDWMNNRDKYQMRVIYWN